VAVVLLLGFGGSVTAQSATDQSFKAIPQQVKESAETKATTKTNTVSNNTMNKLDSASNKAFKGFTNLFKKKNNSKNKNPRTDSSGIHPADSLAALPKTSSRTSGKPSFYCDLPVPLQPERPADGHLAYEHRYIHHSAIESRILSGFSTSV
jgi:hypothetical protein